MGTGEMKMHRNKLVIFYLCLSIVICAAGGVYAYITAGTDTLSNAFTPATVSCTVEEVFENGVKENVRVRNTGNIDAYIRAVVVATFVSEEGKVLAVSPKEGVDYTVTWGTSGWVKGSDGYWYHRRAVAPGTLTAVLVETISATSVPDGYRLNIQIVASAIQSVPESSVTEAWGVSLSNGEIVPD
jgi:hypothetical protein